MAASHVDAWREFGVKLDLTFGCLYVVPAETFGAPAQQSLDQQHVALQGAADWVVVTAGVEIAVEVLLQEERLRVFVGEKLQRHVRPPVFRVLQPHSTWVQGQLGAMSQQHVASDVRVQLIATMVAVAQHKRLYVTWAGDADLPVHLTSTLTDSGACAASDVAMADHTNQKD